MNLKHGAKLFGPKIFLLETFWPMWHFGLKRFGQVCNKSDFSAKDNLATTLLFDFMEKLDGILLSVFNCPDLMIIKLRNPIVLKLSPFIYYLSVFRSNLEMENCSKVLQIIIDNLMRPLFKNAILSRLSRTLFATTETRKESRKVFLTHR